MVNRNSILFLLLAALLKTAPAMAATDGLTDVPVAAPIDSDSAGHGGEIATHAVVRVICVEQNSMGTGFLHKSGKIITADHVVRGCPHLLSILPDGSRSELALLASDQDHDLAIVQPNTAISATPLPISVKHDLKIGTQVSTWGYPGGYFGLSPMLSVGYLAGVDAARMAPGKIVRQWVVNAAFNGGNSGGPLLHIETGAVIGVVSSKIAPISQDTAQILQLLESEHSGLTYTGTKADGTKVTFTEGQLIGMVLKELRLQVQLVIGKAVLLEDLTAFLRSQNIEP
jgi:S1-C subfamily serine protease